VFLVTNLHDFEAPPLGFFIGRRNELRILESQGNFFIIEGIAGIGKTSLALKFVEKIKGKRHVFWHTLKEVDSFSFLINKLAIFLSRFQYLDLINYLKAGGADDSTKMALLLKGLDDENYVLIFDDYQRHRDEKINVLFRYLQKNLKRAKVIILSRIRPKFFTPLDPNVIEMKLLGLNISETLTFLSNKGIHVKLDEVVKIQEKLSGHPLALNMFCEAFKGKDLIKVLESLPEFGLLEYFWNEVYQTLSESERKLLKHISVFREPVSIKTINNILNVRNIWSILHALRRKMIIEHVNGEYFLHEVIRDLCYRLIDNPEKMHRLAARYYSSKRSTRAFLEATYHMIKAKDFQEAAQSIRDDLAFNKWSCIEGGYLSQYLDLLESIPMEAISEELSCWILYGKGRAYLACGEFIKAIQCFSDSLTMVKDPLELDLRARIFRYLGKANLRIGKIKIAEKYFIESLKLLEKTNNLNELGKTFLELAILYLFEGDPIMMRYSLDRGLEFCSKVKDKRSMAMGYYHYAGLYEMMSEWENAIISCEKSLRIFEEVKDVLWTAILHAELAFIKTFL